MIDVLSLLQPQAQVWNLSGSLSALLPLMVIHSCKNSLFVATKQDPSFQGKTLHPETVLVLYGQNNAPGK